MGAHFSVREEACGSDRKPLRLVTDRGVAVAQAARDLDVAESASPHAIRTVRQPKSRSASFAGSLEPVAFTCSVMNRFDATGAAEIERVI